MRSGIWCLVLGVFPAFAATAPATGLFELYANNRTSGTPNYITPDLLLLTYSSMLDRAVAGVETQHWYPALRDAVQALEHAASAKEAGDEAAYNYLRVLDALLNGRDTDPNPAVAEELAKIKAAAGPAPSKLAGQTLDYSQFKPRGHYTQSPVLARYFQAVQYGSLVLFPVQNSAATGIGASAADRMIDQAVHICQWIDADAAVKKSLAGFDGERAWLFGPSEDLSCADLLRVSREQPKAAPAAWRASLLAFARANHRQPTVWNAVVETDKLETGVTVADVLTGFRLIPGSFTPDSAAAQQLVYSRVGKYLGHGKPLSLTTVNGTPVKGFPLAGEILAMLGSADAQQTLVQHDDTNYEGYANARTEAQALMGRNAGLATLQFNMLRTWLTSGKAPDRAASAAAFFTLYRHTNVLYAKQSYTAAGKGIAAKDTRTTAWIEPEVELYTALLGLSGELHKRLPSAGFDVFSKLLEQSIAIARQIRTAAALSPEQVAFLNGLDEDLLRLAGSRDEPIAVDIHTDVNSGQTMVEALADPVEAFHKAAGARMRGGRFKHCEFTHPLSDRLTDEKWREMLAAQEAQ